MKMIRRIWDKYGKTQRVPFIVALNLYIFLMTKFFLKIKFVPKKSSHQVEDPYLFLGFAAHLTELSEALLFRYQSLIQEKKIAPRLLQTISVRQILHELLTHQQIPIPQAFSFWDHPFRYRLAVPPHPLVSFSHTDLVGISAMTNHPSFEGLGIDVENSTRRLLPQSTKYFQGPSDQVRPISGVSDLLILWTCKEAAFKTLSSFANAHSLGYTSPTSLLDVWVKEETFGLSDCLEKPLGSLYSFLLPYQNENYLISIALKSDSPFLIHSSQQLEMVN
jgi:hypothetical protein